MVVGGWMNNEPIRSLPIGLEVGNWLTLIKLVEDTTKINEPTYHHLSKTTT